MDSVIRIKALETALASRSTKARMRDEIVMAFDKVHHTLAGLVGPYPSKRGMYNARKQVRGLHKVIAPLPNAQMKRELARSIRIAVGQLNEAMAYTQFGESRQVSARFVAQATLEILSAKKLANMLGPDKYHHKTVVKKLNRDGTVRLFKEFWTRVDEAKKWTDVLRRGPGIGSDKTTKKIYALRNSLKRLLVIFRPYPQVTERDAIHTALSRAKAFSGYALQAPPHRRIDWLTDAYNELTKVLKLHREAEVSLRKKS
jgi:hypothetical protein